MEEAILKLIQWSLRQPHNEEVCEEIASKEIADTFERFMEWQSENTESTSLDRWYIYGADATLSSKELFTYWNTNFNK